MKKPEFPEAVRAALTHADARLLEALAELVPGAQASPPLLRERILADVARPRLRFAPLFGSLSELFDLSELELAAVFERAMTPQYWTRPALPGVELLDLVGGPRVAGADNGLVRLARGAAFPQHKHLGLERVLVLEGGYRDEPSGRIYQAADRHEMARGSSHCYTALPDRALLLAVSVEGGVDVDGLGRLSAGSR